MYQEKVWVKIKAEKPTSIMTEGEDYMYAYPSNSFSHAMMHRRTGGDNYT